MEQGNESDEPKQGKFLPDKKKLRPPDKKNIDSHLNQIKLKEKELKNCNSESECIRQEMKTLQPNRYFLNEEKKKNNLELKTLREEILVKNNNLSRLESVLTYKNEHKINEAIKKLELQLSCNNFKVREKRKIVAEIDSLKGSKKFLVNYLAQKKEIDELREQQLKKRRENEQYHRQVSMLISKEDEMRFRLNILQTTIESLHLELNGLNEQKKVLLSDYKRREKDHNVMKDAIRKKNRQNSKHKEEEKRPPIHRNNREDVPVVYTPEEECLQHCNSLIHYLQQFPVADLGQTSCQVPSPTEETAAALGPASEIQGEHGATYRLLTKNDECEELYFGAGRRQNKKNKRGRRFSATKPLTHSPEVIAQFEDLQMSAPVGFAEIQPALKQLEEKKKYFECLIKQGEEGLIPPSKVQEGSVEQDDVCLSDSGYSADGSAACELSRQVSHTESTEGSPSNISLLEIISIMQAEAVRNDHQTSWSSSSSSESSSSEDDDDNILQGVGNGLQKTPNASNTLTPLAQSQTVATRQLPRQHEVRDLKLDRKEATLITDSQPTAASLLCKTLPAKSPSAKLGMSNLKLASVISYDSCTEETQSSEELFLIKAPDPSGGCESSERIIINGGETNGNSSSSSSSSSSSNGNDDLSDRSSRSSKCSRTFLNIVKSKRVRNFPLISDISCDLKGMEYEALTSPSGLRFNNRTAPDPSGGCESSSDDEDRNANAEPIEGEVDDEEEECEEPEPVAIEEEEEDGEGEEEAEEEDEEETVGRKVEEDITDNSDSEKDNEKSVKRGYSESGDDNTDDDDDNNRKLEDEERGLMDDLS